MFGNRETLIKILFNRMFHIQDRWLIYSEKQTFLTPCYAYVCVLSVGNIEQVTLTFSLHHFPSCGTTVVNDKTENFKRNVLIKFEIVSQKSILKLFQVVYVMLYSFFLSKSIYLSQPYLMLVFFSFLPLLYSKLFCRTVLKLIRSTHLLVYTGRVYYTMS